MDIYDETVNLLESGELLILDLPEYSDETDECDEGCDCDDEDDEDETGGTGEEYELDICGKHLFSGECDDSCVNMA